MTTTSPHTIIQALHWRYATKLFDPTKKIPPEDWQALEESLRLAPSSYGLQPWQFIVIQDPTLRKKLTPVSWNQPQIEACSHLVVIATLRTITEDYIQTYIQSIANIRQEPLHKYDLYKRYIHKDLIHGPRHAMIKEWAARQAYIPLGIFMSTAALLHIDTCAIEGFEPDKYNDLIGLTNSEYTATVVIAAGYRAQTDVTASNPKVRFDSDTMVRYL